MNSALVSDFLTISLGVKCTSGSSVPITTIPIGLSDSLGSFSIIDFNQDIRFPSFWLNNEGFMQRHAYKLFVKRSKIEENFFVLLSNLKRALLDSFCTSNRVQ